MHAMEGQNLRQRTESRICRGIAARCTHSAPAVLYEDLRLETMAASEVSLPMLEAIGLEHRRIYFARRSIGTLREMAETVRLLDALPTFLPIKDDFDETSAIRWRKAVRFFLKWEPYIERIRHDVSGHFGLKPAVFALAARG